MVVWRTFGGSRGVDLGRVIWPLEPAFPHHGHGAWGEKPDGDGLRQHFVYIARLTVCRASGRDESRPYISDGEALPHCYWPLVRNAD